MRQPTQPFPSSSFLDLVARRFGGVGTAFAYDELREQYDTLRLESDVDLFLWSLARQLKIDTEELLRQLGERWAQGLAEERPELQPQASGFLQAADWLFSQSGLLATAPVPGMEAFRVDVMSRGPNAMRLRCAGPRRCCSFVEGVVRALGELGGETVRYVRQPHSAALVELLFKSFEKAEPKAAYR